MELDPKYASVIIRRYVESHGSDDVFLVRENEKIPYSKVTEINEGYEDFITGKMKKTPAYLFKLN